MIVYAIRRTHTWRGEEIAPQDRVLFQKEGMSCGVFAAYDNLTSAKRALKRIEGDWNKVKHEIVALDGEWQPVV